MPVVSTTAIDHPQIETVNLVIKNRPIGSAVCTSLYRQPHPRLLVLLSLLAFVGVVYAATFTPFALARMAAIPTPTPPPPPRALPPLQMVMLTDWHIDPNYRTRCPNGSRFGQYECDPPHDLLVASLEAAAAAVPDADVVIVLGDFVAHGSPSGAFTRDVFNATSRAITAAFPSNPYACTAPLGNNDIYLPTSLMASLMTSLIRYACTAPLGNNDVYPNYIVDANPNLAYYAP
jgi:hypothetical protein